MKLSKCCKSVKRDIRCGSVYVYLYEHLPMYSGLQKTRAEALEGRWSGIAAAQQQGHLIGGGAVVIPADEGGR